MVTVDCCIDCEILVRDGGSDRTGLQGMVAPPEVLHALWKTLVVGRPQKFSLMLVEGQIVTPKLS